MIATLPPTTPEPSFTAEPPPKRFSAAAVEDWTSVSQTLRAEVLRLEAELTAGLRKYQAAAARDADLNEFHDRAAKGGTNLKEVLTRYVDMEDLLRIDPDAGLEALFENIGISPREWAMKLLGQVPDADSTAEAVEKFAAAHPRFEELSEDIAFFLDTGRANDVVEAYKLAERINPAPSEADGGEGAN
jgi:hypothetical protein